LRSFGTTPLACQCGTSLALTFLRILQPKRPILPLGALQLATGLHKVVTYQPTSTTTRWSLTLLSAVTGQVVPTPVLDAQERARIWSPMLLTMSVSFLGIFFSRRIAQCFLCCRCQVGYQLRCCLPINIRLKPSLFALHHMYIIPLLLLQHIIICIFYPFVLLAGSVTVGIFCAGRFLICCAFRGINHTTSIDYL
jgi:hypothetical protein